MARRACERLHAYFKARDWNAITALLTNDYCGDDRRSVVGAGIRRSPDAAIEDYRSASDIDVTDAGSDTVATRGARLALTRAHYARSGNESEAFRVDFLQLVEIDSAGRIAPMAALDTRYLAGEASAHARVVCHCGGLRRFQPARAARDHAGLCEHRPPARDCVRTG